VCDSRGQVDSAPIAQRVRYLERSIVVAAHPGKRGRVISRRPLRRVLLRRFHRQRPARQQQGASRGDADAVDEVAARDRTIHPECAIVFWHGDSCDCRPGLADYR
jgi:hypothetical protein